MNGKFLKNISLSFLIMVAMIGVLILFITLISATSYSETIQNLEHDWEMSIINTDLRLSDSLILVAHGFRLFELTYDSDLKEAFVPFLEAYNLSNGKPLLIDLGKIRRGLPPKIASKLDLYIIDEQGIVINTTYASDAGLDFKKWPEVYNNITEIRRGDSFKSDRSVLGFNKNKMIRKFACLPTPDHRYVLELSTTIEEYPNERAKFSYLSVADSISNKSPFVRSITLYDKMMRPIKKDAPTSEETNNKTRYIVQKVFQDQTVMEIQNPEQKTTDIYLFIKTGGNETVSDNMLDLVARITYDTTEYRSRLLSIFYYHLLIAIISAILGIFLVYLLTRYLTRPVTRIIEDIDIIAKGDLNHPIHHSGSPEFNRLEGSINLLVSSLQTLIESLQEKEARLTVSEYRYRSLIENQSDVILRFDSSGVITYVNDAFCSFFGFQQIIGASIFDLVSEGVSKDISEFIRFITEETPSSIIEHQITLRNGQIKWLQWSGSGIFTNGHIIEYQAVGRDITARKEVEEALRESEEKYRWLIANLPDYVVVHRKGIILFVNELLAQVIGCPSQEMIGTYVFAYIPDEEHQMSSGIIGRRMAGEMIPEYELHLKQRSGSIRTVIVRASIIPYEGEPALLTVLTDITDKKNSENTIRKGEKRHLTLIEQLNEGFLTTDNNAKITFTNNMFQQMLKYSVDEIVGKPIFSFIAPDDIPIMKQKKCNRLHGISERYQITFLSKPGDRVYTEVSATPSHDKEGRINGSFAVITDITERKIAEEKICVYTRDLEEKTRELEVLRDQLYCTNKNLDRIVKERTEQVMNLLKQKDEFIMQLGHDLRTPLTPIIGLLPDLIEDENRDGNQYALKLINQNVWYIHDIASKSLKLAKMSSFDINPEIEPVDIRNTVTNLIAAHEGDFNSVGITPIHEVPEDLIIAVDKILFQELIENIISNGIKYIQRIEGVITFSACISGDYAEIRISDNGKGLRAEEREKIFEEFYKSDQSRHDKSSTGLGLSICRRIVKNHGGSIRAESEGPGAGTSFIIMLPLWKE